jgi:hypothetical protein
VLEAVQLPARVTGLEKREESVREKRDERQERDREIGV